MASALGERGGRLLDAPVSGGVSGAESGELTLMVGGDASLLGQHEAVLKCFSKAIIHVGDIGAGTIAKLINNQIFLACALAVQEGFVLGAKAGLDANTLFSITRKSSARGYVGLAPLLMSRDFSAAAFKLGIARKDLAVALDAADGLGVSMPLTTAALGVYDEAVSNGRADMSFSATLLTLEQHAGAEVMKVEAAS
jgi:3-hydroxyisobutyrate dehydrogenase-like beta-hydroxyacid dehydrogenase